MTYQSDVLKALAGSPTGVVATLSGTTSVSGTYTAPVGAPVQVTVIAYGYATSGSPSINVNGVTVALGASGGSVISATFYVAGGATYSVGVQQISGATLSALITQRKID